jgi:class 3 adenylate cyclase
LLAYFYTTLICAYFLLIRWIACFISFKLLVLVRMLSDRFNAFGKRLSKLVCGNKLYATVQPSHYAISGDESDGAESEASNSLMKPHLKTHSEKAKAYCSYFVRNKKIFVICMISYMCVVTAMIAIIFAISKSNEEEQKDVARSKVVATEYFAYKGLSVLSNKLNVLGLSVLAVMNCSEIVSVFPSYAEEILNGTDNPKRLYFDAVGTVASVYPPIDFDGTYYSNHSFFESQDLEYSRVMHRRDVSMSFPFPHPDGYLGAYMYYPLWRRATHASVDVGCDSYSNCTTDDCWNPDSKIKFVGMVRALISLGEVASTTIKSLPEYSVCIYGKREGSDDKLRIIFCSDTDQLKPVSERFDLFGLTYVVRLSLLPPHSVLKNDDDPWAPKWKYGFSIILMVAGVPFSMFLYWALASQEKYGRLLSLILPRRVIDHLGFHTGVFSEEFPDISILFSDICGFTPLAAKLTPVQIVGMLDELYGLYDDLALKHGVYKVETIGDAYVVSCGCPDKVDPVIAALRLVAMAKDMLKVVSNFKPSYLPKGFRVRVGINSGGVVCGVVGRTMPRYCLFGNVVNIACKMEGDCEPMHIQISESTCKLIEHSNVGVTEKSVLDINWNGSMKTYYVDTGLDQFQPIDLSSNMSVNSITSISNKSRTKNVAFCHVPGTRGSSLADDSQSLRSNNYESGLSSFDTAVVKPRSGSTRGPKRKSWTSEVVTSDLGGSPVLASPSGKLFLHKELDYELDSPAISARRLKISEDLSPKLISMDNDSPIDSSRENAVQMFSSSTKEGARL